MPRKPPTEPWHPYVFRIPLSLWAALLARAKAAEQSVNALLVKIIRAVLDDESLH